jgi:Berberine and berberine like
VFWGSNYEKLSQIKRKYDPSMVFWASPGINADLMEVRNGRLCNARTTENVKSDVGAAPKNDDENFANLLKDGESLFGQLERWGGYPPREFKYAELRIGSGMG